MTFYIFAFWFTYIVTLIAIGHDLYHDYKYNDARIFQDGFHETLVEIIIIILMLIPIINLIVFLKYSSEQRQLLTQTFK